MTVAEKPATKIRPTVAVVVESRSLSHLAVIGYVNHRSKGVAASNRVGDLSFFQVGQPLEVLGCSKVAFEMADGCSFQTRLIEL